MRLSIPCVALARNPLEGVPTRCTNIRKAAMLSRPLSLELCVPVSSGGGSNGTTASNAAAGLPGELSLL